MIELAYVKVKVIHDMAKALDLFTEGKVEEAIKLAESSVELMKKYKKIMEVARK